MKKQLFVVAIAIAALAFVTACGKKQIAGPPAAAVVAPAPPPPAPPPSQADFVPQENEYDRLKKRSSDEIDKMGLLTDVHFDFDKSDLRETDRPLLAKNAEVLKKYDFLIVTVEGHCDSRGTVEYNLALGERRAKATFDYLASLGVPMDRLKTVSYGKEIQLCQEETEDCWARNRRAHFAVTGKTR
jgi:peptidoglycan-associated lipoprotein